MRSLLPRLVGQRSNGKKGQQKMEDVCGHHGLE